MQLVQVDAFDTEAAQRGFDVVAQIPRRIAAAHWRIVAVAVGPADRLRLGGDIDLAAPPLLQRLPDDGLAVALAVEFGGIDEVDALFEGVQQGVDGVLVVDLPPVAADLPGAKADFADLPAGAAERAVLHGAAQLSDACFCFARDMNRAFIASVAASVPSWNEPNHLSNGSAASGP